MSTSKMASRTTVAATMTTRSASRGIPRGRSFSIRFRYPNSSHRLRSIRLPAEYVRQFVEPSLFPIRFDVRKILTVYPRCAVVCFAPLVRIGQHVFAIHLVVQQVEPIVRLLLSFHL